MKADKALTRDLLTRNFGKIDPRSIDDYVGAGGYQALEKALLLPAREIIAQVKAAELKGRGGAAFPTGIKMETVSKATGFPKYLICNGDEGEPGNFKDRYLMENDPHALIEGMIISARATGAEKGFIFIRGEYQKSIDIVKGALEQARCRRYLGSNIMGTGFHFDIEVFTGAGSYVCGEEYSLMVCIEGKPSRSTYKPPYPTIQGLFEKPTQINNVETFANIPVILRMGAKAYAQIGTASSKGTKLVSLCGHVKKPGLYEVPFGVTIRDIIEGLGGGVPGGRSIKLVQLGGASGPVVPESMLDIRLDYREMAENDLTFGSGAIIVMDDRVEILDIIKRVGEFFLHESCGKCTPCREGTIQMLILLDRFIGKTATQQDMTLLKVLTETMRLASICGLGQAAPTAVRSALRFFPDEFALAALPEREVV